MSSTVTSSALPAAEVAPTIRSSRVLNMCRIRGGKRAAERGPIRAVPGPGQLCVTSGTSGRGRPKHRHRGTRTRAATAPRR